MTTFTPLPAFAQPRQLADTLVTPCLVLQADAFERNLQRMQAAATHHGVALRPHAKAHKTPAVALAQLHLGAVGICVQKASEALPFLQAGVRDVHVSNQLASAQQAGWLARWAREGAADGVRLSVCVDDARQVSVLTEAAHLEGLAGVQALGVHVEIDIGQGRCGVAGADRDVTPVLQLVDAIQAAPGLRWSGLQAYHGGVQHLRSAAERRQAAAASTDRAAAVVSALQARGLRPPVVTGSGTGSVAFDLARGVYTEVQPGSYAFMDGDYADNQASEGLEADDLAFEHALFLACTVMSTAQPGQVVLDAGLKTLSAESGPPRPWPPRSGWGTVRLNDEHGVLPIEASARAPGLGDVLHLIPGHCDPSFNLHDQLVVLRDGRVHDLWPIAARGHSR